MRILFVCANRNQDVTPVFPLGLAYVAGSLPPTHEVQVLDIFLAAQYQQELSSLLSSFQPQLIGIHVRNLDLQDSYAPASLLGDAYAVVKQCRQFSQAPIVIGGPAVGIVPGEMLRYFGASAAVAGEGETIFRNIVAGLASGMSIASIPGVITLDKTNAGMIPTYGREDVDKLPYPSWALCSLPGYLSSGAMANIQGKRGCPFRCIFCSTPQLEGNITRLRKPEAVVEELRLLVRDFGVEKVYFVDNNFNYPPEHAAAVCEAIIRSELRLPWVCQLHPAYIDAQLVGLLKRAG
jgi:radical SAM superfamily enzyme YgiQ (UPF0313 family)